MQNGPSRQNALAAYGLLLVCVVVAWSACMGGAGVWPFGEGTLALIDNIQQQAPDFGSISRWLEGSESLTWSYASGGGVRSFLTPFSQNGVFPTTWAAWLMPWDNILQALSWQLLFQLVLAAFSCCWYLRRRYRRTPWLLQVGLAFSYAFSHFFLTKYLCVNFLNIYAVFPLFLAALDSLLERGRLCGYVVLMSLMMGFAPYFAWMFCLFTLVYALSDRRPRRLWAGRARLATLVWGTIAAAAISCVLWLPTVLHMADSARAGTVSTELLPLGAFYPDEVTYWTLLPLSCACLMTASARRLRAVLFSREGMTAMALCFCLLFAAATFVWCMGPPVCFRSRFSYMVCMLMCCLACRTWDGAPVHAWGGRCALLFLAMSALMAIGWWFLRFEPWVRSAALWGFAIGAVAVPALCIFIRRPACLLAVCMVGTVVVFPGFFHFHRGYGNVFLEIRENRLDHDRQVDGMIRGAALCMAPGDRIKSWDLALMENCGEYTAINRFSNNFQTLTSKQGGTMDGLGYLRWWTRQMDIGGTALSDSFLGFRYFASETPALDGLAPHVHAGQGLHLYENPFYWGVGALVRSADAMPAPEGAPAIDRQKALYRLLAGDGAGGLFDNRQGGVPAEPAWCYVQCGDHPELFDACSFPELKALGGRPHGNIILKIGNAVNTTSCLEMDADALAALSRRLRGGVDVLRVAKDGVDLKIHRKAGDNRDMLLFPLLYHKGYSASEGGRDLEVVDAMGFVGIMLPEYGSGTDVVRLRFSLPGQNAGGAVSVCGILVSLALCFRRKRNLVGDSPSMRCAGGVLLVCGYIAVVAVCLWTLYWCAAFIVTRL